VIKMILSSVMEFDINFQEFVNEGFKIKSTASHKQLLFCDDNL
jgi:hypothetical protein